MRKNILLLLLLFVFMVGCGSNLKKNPEQEYLNKVNSILDEAIKDNMADYKTLKYNSAPTSTMYDKKHLDKVLKENKDGINKLKSISKPDTDRAKKIYSKALYCLNKAQEEVLIRKTIKKDNEIKSAMNVMEELNLAVADFKLMKLEEEKN